jgi:hypothetical protein
MGGGADVDRGEPSHSVEHVSAEPPVAFVDTPIGPIPLESELHAPSSHAATKTTPLRPFTCIQ